MKRSILFIFILSGFFSPVLAQTPGPTPTAALHLQPIDTHFSTLGGMTYVMGNDELKSYDDFQNVIAPLNDYETQRLLNRSITTDDLSHIFKAAGLIALVGGVVGIAANNNTNSQVPFAIGVLGGGIALDVGALFGQESQTTKFNAVQRYNRFAYGREAVLPQAPSDEKSLLPLSTPVTQSP